MKARKEARKQESAASSAQDLSAVDLIESPKNTEPLYPVSLVQLEANRRNAQLSTGPKTAEGEAISAKNNFKHGFCGAFQVLESESQQDCDGFATIVGLHLLPLARLFKYPPHYVTGILLVLWSAVVALRFHAPEIASYGALGTALILFVSAVCSLATASLGQRRLLAKWPRPRRLSDKDALHPSSCSLLGAATLPKVL